MNLKETNYFDRERMSQGSFVKSARKVKVICLENNQLSRISYQFGVLIGSFEKKLKKMTTFLKVVRIKGRGKK